MCVRVRRRHEDACQADLHSHAWRMQERSDGVVRCCPLPGIGNLSNEVGFLQARLQLFRSATADISPHSKFCHMIGWPWLMYRRYAVKLMPSPTVHKAVTAVYAVYL